MYDIIFVGGGLNYAGAVVAAKKGLKVALIQENLDELGGVCLHKGCIPSKHFLHLSSINLELRNKAFKIKKDKLKLKEAQKEIDEIISKATKSIIVQCQNAGVELYESKGYITSPNKVETQNKILEGKYIVIGTGSSPFIPQGIDYNKESIITSDDVFHLNEFPKSIAIYGSGAIGLEFAGFFAANSIDTTLIYRHETISKKIHPRLVKSLEKKLTQIGVKLMPNTSILEAKDFEKKAKITTNKGVFEFEKLLVATGRAPNTDVIKTDMIKVDKGIKTDEYFQTSLLNHFAIGDCNKKLQLAHAARSEVLNVVNNILGKKEKINLNNIPKFIYSLPLQYASIGLTKSELDKRQVEYREASFPLSALALSYSHDAKEGEVILYADKENFIIGAEMLIPHAEELIGILSVAISAELDKESFIKSVFAHPTFSEALERAARRI